MAPYKYKSRWVRKCYALRAGGGLVITMLSWRLSLQLLAPVLGFQGPGCSEI